MVPSDHVGMTTYETSVGGDSRVDIIRILVLVEAAIASVMVIEALAAIAFSGPAAAPLVLAAVIAAAGTLWLVQGIGRRSKRARKFAIWLQVGILIVAALDLLLAILLAQRSLELVPTLTRVVLPLTVFRLLRKPDVRAEFGARQSRRTRKRSAEVSS